MGIALEGITLQGGLKGLYSAPIGDGFPTERGDAMAKREIRFDIDRFVATIEARYKSCNPPIITFIATRGATPFEVLVSTLLSLRTKADVTAEQATRLF